ncbi:SERTA domain-containing protein 3 [Hoplias malabaricus]|uniref:SERTA domain-containing protein 3 n=1 Tax=Hoplias malabaricus TaxID=27720 RepID=UPI003461B8D4
MGARGLKRKLQERDEGEGSVLESQLQCVLDISLDKFQRDQALVEPSLLRSVLINNTLRQVQSKAKGSLPETNELWGTPQPLTPLSDPVSQRANTFPGLSSSLLSLEMEDAEDDFMAWSTDEDFSLSSAISSILKNLDAALDSGCSASLPQRSPLSSLENIPGDGWFRTSPSFSHNESLRNSEAEPSVGLTSFLHDATVENLLLDMDSSVLEGEVDSFGPGNLSFPNEALAIYLPSLSTTSSSSSASSSSGVREKHELQHILDILVQS